MDRYSQQIFLEQQLIFLAVTISTLIRNETVNPLFPDLYAVEALHKINKQIAEFATLADLSNKDQIKQIMELDRDLETVIAKSEERSLAPWRGDE